MTEFSDDEVAGAHPAPPATLFDYGGAHNKEMSRAKVAAELRLAGLDWEGISEKCNYKSPSTAMHAVTRYVGDRWLKSRDVATVLDLEAERLDRLQLSYWRAALEGDIQAARFVLDVMKFRGELLGYTRVKEAGSITNNTAVFIAGDETQFIEGIRNIRGTHPPELEE